MEKYPSIPHADDPGAEGLLSNRDRIVVTEKVDGANFRFRRTENGALLFGKRGGLFTADAAGTPKPIDECDRRFAHAMYYLYDAVDFDALDAVHDEHGELWFYGECLVEHTVAYDAWDGIHPHPSGPVPNFLGFDIYAAAAGEFLGYDEVWAAFDRLGLEAVPVVRETSADEITGADWEIPESAYRTPDPDADNEFDRQGLAEGIVVWNVDRDIHVKHVHGSFEERNTVMFNDVRQAQSVSGAFVAAYITDARVRKHAHKLLDEGRYDELSLRMMQDLPDLVVDDAIAEEGRDIDAGDVSGLVEGKTERLARKKAGRKCESLLKEMVVERNRGRGRGR